jgi:hypothetical protein
MQGSFKGVRFIATTINKKLMHENDAQQNDG